DFYKEVSNLYRNSYPLKSAIKEIAVPFCAKRLFWGSFSYLKFRALMRKLRYAYKMERIMPAVTYSSPSVNSVKIRGGTEKNNSV
ncbi:MAG: hypothetical protein V3S16_16045, partial [Candidatus Desulfatibia sp.]|uniref:hypothetical protein n=1 Tax=Candidatus Desulfatibia sp. TaxID=3101189 RepID=UPI002F2FF879